MLDKLTATVIFVDDLKTCTTFYENFLGLESLFTDEVSAAYKMEGHDFVLLETPAAIEMVGEDALSLGKGVAHRIMLCVGVEDVDASYKSLTAKGLTFLKPPKSQDWGRRTAYFADPEGNIWELWQDLPEE